MVFIQISNKWYRLIIYWLRGKNLPETIKMSKPPWNKNPELEGSAAEASAHKSGRGFQEETLQAVRVRPRMVFKE